MMCDPTAIQRPRKERLSIGGALFRESAVFTATLRAGKRTLELRRLLQAEQLGAGLEGFSFLLLSLAERDHAVNADGQTL